MHSLLVQIIISVLTSTLMLKIFRWGPASCNISDPLPISQRKLNKSQADYTTMEKEIISIVATLEYFRSMLLGANIHVFTDH